MVGMIARSWASGVLGLSESCVRKVAQGLVVSTTCSVVAIRGPYPP